MFVDDFLALSAARFPGKDALVTGGRRFTYGSLETQCRRLSAALMEAGVERGDRVGVFLENSVEAVVSIFAILRAGAAFVLIPPTAKEQKLIRILADAGAAALVFPSERIDEINRACVSCASLHFLVVVGGKESDSRPRIRRFEEIVASDAPIPALAASPAAHAARARIDLDLAALVYTSGSSGRPKGVMLSHLNMVSAANSVSAYLGLSEDDVIAGVLPLSFDYGLYQVLMAFKAGARIVLERSFVYPNVLLTRIGEEKVTLLPAVPTIIAILLRLDLARYDLSSLRAVTSTGAALPLAHIAEFRRRLPRVRFFSMYGLTECHRVSYLDPEQIDCRPQSVGKAMPNTEAFVADENGVPVPPGVTGELVVRGSHVMLGYWALPEESARVLRPGRYPGERILRTGDDFRVDEEGFLTFVSRRDDVIKCRGEKVSPREIEDVLYRLDGVEEAMIVGAPDEILGEAIKALVVLRHGAKISANDVLRHCSLHLEDLLVPTQVEFLASLPRSANGKIVRHASREGATS